MPILAIRSIRERQGLTLEELAQRSNVASATLSGYERYVRNPRLEYILRIAKALRVDIRDLITAR
jgi:transcriptional regulator with XRE-family HTH domain